MPVYSFRAECQDDVDQVLQALDAVGVSRLMRTEPDGEFPDVKVELETHATLETIRNTMRRVGWLMAT